MNSKYLRVYEGNVKWVVFDSRLIGRNENGDIMEC